MNAQLESSELQVEAILDLISSLFELQKIAEEERDEMKLMAFEEDSCFLALAAQRVNKECDDECFLF